MDSADTPEQNAGGIFYVTQILPLEADDDILQTPPEDADDIQLQDRFDSEKCTYQLEPSVVIHPEEVSSIARHVLKHHLQDRVYESTEEMRQLLLKVSSDIREQVRSLNLDRYKIVCQVSVGEMCGQDIAMNFLCLWKHEFDRYAVATFEGRNFFATALVFLIYKT